MPLHGQASGSWTESSSALRLLHVGVRNAVGILADDAFTQTNPPIETTASTVSTNVDTAVLGVLSGSIAFARPDAGPNVHGGPAEPGAPNEVFIRPLGLYVNSAVGDPFVNTPGPASGKTTYVSSQGTYSSALFETQALDTTTGGSTLAQGDDITWVTGQGLIASRNGYLIPELDGSDGITTFANATNSSEIANSVAAATELAILKMPADSEQAEIVFDQRV